jgi:hypothetical protein
MWLSNPFLLYRQIYRNYAGCCSAPEVRWMYICSTTFLTLAVLPPLCDYHYRHTKWSWIIFSPLILRWNNRAYVTIMTNNQLKLGTELTFQTPCIHICLWKCTLPKTSTYKFIIFYFQNSIRLLKRQRSFLPLVQYGERNEGRHPLCIREIRGSNLVPGTMVCHFLRSFRVRQKPLSSTFLPFITHQWSTIWRSIVWGANRKFK